MGFVWPERRDGPRTTPRALTALTSAHECLSTARQRLTEAERVDWVSEAADRYRQLLAATAQDVARLAGALEEAGFAVLRHTSAADAARETAEAEAAVGRLVLPVWQPGPSPVLGPPAPAHQPAERSR